METQLATLAVLAPRGRPRSEAAHRAILETFREILIQDRFGRLRLERVAAQARVSKATIYRHWRSKEELAIELLHELASPPDRGRARHTDRPRMTPHNEAAVTR